MRTVVIPGGVARFKDRNEMRGRDSKMVKAATIAAQGALAKLPDEARPKPGESEKDAAVRMEEVLKTTKLDLTQEEAMALLSMKEAIVVAYLASWTLDIPLPTLETIGDLPEEIYDALDNAVGGEYLTVTSPDFSPGPDQNSPTGPSSDSSSSLRAEPVQTEELTSKPLNGTDPSAGESSSGSPSEITTTLTP